MVYNLYVRPSSIVNTIGLTNIEHDVIIILSGITGVGGMDMKKKGNGVSVRSIQEEIEKIRLLVIKNGIPINL